MEKIEEEEGAKRKQRHRVFHSGDGRQESRSRITGGGPQGGGGGGLNRASVYLLVYVRQSEDAASPSLTTPKALEA